MKLVDYINEGYTIVTTPETGLKIKKRYPKAHVRSGIGVDGIPTHKLLVDYYFHTKASIQEVISSLDAFAVERFTVYFVEGENHVKQSIPDEVVPNLLEIKLKDTDSVPEVYYKGEFLGGLTNVSYYYRMATDTVPHSANDVRIEYYGTVNDFPDKKTIEHKRDI